MNQRSLLDFLNDDAIHRRTPAGQRALLDPRVDLTHVERRFLSVVTGYTPLHVLLDMGVDDADMAAAITALAERGFIALESLAALRA